MYGNRSINKRKIVYIVTNGIKRLTAHPVPVE